MCIDFALDISHDHTPLRYTADKTMVHAAGAVGAAAEVRGSRSSRAGDADPGFAAATRRVGGSGRGPFAGQDRGSGRRSRTRCSKRERAVDAAVAAGQQPRLHQLHPGTAVMITLMAGLKGCPLYLGPSHCEFGLVACCTCCDVSGQDPSQTD